MSVPILWNIRLGVLLKSEDGSPGVLQNLMIDDLVIFTFIVFNDNLILISV